MLSLRRNASQNDEGTARFLYAILRQLETRSVDWDEVAEDIEATNGHAARMRWTRFKAHMEGGVTSDSQQSKKRASEGYETEPKKTKKRAAKKLGKGRGKAKEKIQKIKKQEEESGDDHDDDDYVDGNDGQDGDGDGEQPISSEMKVEEEGGDEDAEGEDEDAEGETELATENEPTGGIAATSAMSGLIEDNGDMGLMIGEEFDELMNDPFFMGENF